MALLSEYEHVEMSLEAEFPCAQTQVHEIHGKEAIGRLFSFDIEIVRLEEAELDPEQAVGARASLRVTRKDREIRRINGIISQIEGQLDDRTKFRTYKLKLVPTAHNLALRRSQRIFMDKNVAQIITETLNAAGVNDFRLDIHGPLANAPRQMTVQYAETDLAFVSRLAEHHGISFYFEHENAARGKDTLVFTDRFSNSGFLEIDSSVTLRRGGDRRDVYELGKVTRQIPGKYAVNDYNYETAKVSLAAEKAPPANLKNTKWFNGRIVEYGPNYQFEEQGKELAQIRAEEGQVKQIVYNGASDLPEFSAGYRVHVVEGLTSSTEQTAGQLRVDPDFDKRLLLIEVEHEGRFGTLTHGSDGPGKEKFYRARFRAIPVEHMYRPARVTPKPRIDGLVTGMVVEDIQKIGIPKRDADIDNDGRYSVRLLFEDLQGDEPAERPFASLPIRMLQPHAGVNYGVHFPLKPGIEVLIGFLDGDPDRPFIVGATYRPDTPSPVVSRNAMMNRIITESGVLIEMRDAKI